MTRQVGPREQGRLQGANASLMGIASLIGPALFTQTFALLHRRGAPHLPGAPFLLARAAAGLGWIAAADAGACAGWLAVG